jgi:hypothetical protein
VSPHDDLQEVLGCIERQRAHAEVVARSQAPRRRGARIRPSRWTSPRRWPLWAPRSRWTPHWPVLEADAADAPAPPLRPPSDTRSPSHAAPRSPSGSAATASPSGPVPLPAVVSIRSRRSSLRASHRWLAASNVLQPYNWPAFSCPSLAGFGCPPRHRTPNAGHHARASSGASRGWACSATLKSPPRARYAVLASVR